MGFQCGLLALLVAHTVAARVILQPTYPFEVDITNYKLPENFYPENDRDAIPIMQFLQKLRTSNLNKQDLPDADEPAYSISGTRRSLLPLIQPSDIVGRDIISRLGKAREDAFAGLPSRRELDYRKNLELLEPRDLPSFVNDLNYLNVGSENPIWNKIKGFDEGDYLGMDRILKKVATEMVQKLLKAIYKKMSASNFDPR